MKTQLRIKNFPYFVDAIIVQEKDGKQILNVELENNLQKPSLIFRTTNSQKSI